MTTITSTCLRRTRRLLRSVHPRSLGFSIIELLTVISVIAVLAAILVTTVQKVRSRSELTKSVSNLRSLQLANQLYSNEHNGWFVPVAQWPIEGNPTFWHNDPEFRSYFSLEPGRMWPEGLVSPRAEMVHQTDGDLRIDRAYGYNCTDVPGRWGVPGQAMQVHVSQVIDLSKKLAFADALDWVIHRDRADSYEGVEVYTQNATAYRYDGKAAVVFFDGRATALSRDEVVDNDELWDVAER